MLLAMVVTNRLNRSALEEAEREKIAAVTTELRRQVKMLMDSASNDLAALASNRVVTGANTPESERIEEMRRLVRSYKRFDDITLYDSRGLMVRSTTDANHPQALEATVWFDDCLKENRNITSPPHRVLGQEGLHLKVYIPIEIAQQTEPYVLRARLSFQPMDEAFKGVKIGEKGAALLVDSRGDVIAGQAGGADLSVAGSLLENAVFHGQPEGLINLADETFFYHGELLAATETAVGESWAVVTMKPESEILVGVRKAVRAQTVLVLAIMLLAGLIGVFFARKFAKPVMAASHAAKQVSEGNLETRIPEEGATELKQLATSFNSMVDEVRNHRYELEGLVDSRTERLRDSQRELENTHAQLIASYEAAQDGVLVMGVDGSVIAANQRVGDFFGITERVERLSLSSFEEQAAACFPDAESFGLVWGEINRDPEQLAEGEWELVSPVERTLSVYSAPVKNSRGRQIARLWTFRDITEQRNLQKSLEQAQKMEAVGRLAGGVAHDFNNLLTGIIGNLSLVGLNGSRGAGSADDEQFIESAKRAGERAAELVKQLLGFSRQSHLELDYCDANQVVSDAKSLLTSTIDPRISILTDCSDDLWSVKVDATQVEQVVMNMCVNAKDAMEGRGGTIILRSENVTIAASDLADHPLGSAGDYVVLSVEDDGSGIPPEVLANVFEPFFTTKEQGKGTGLGLATSYGIVQQHGGWIDCESTVGEGTTFFIYLPRQDRPKAAPVVDVQREKVVGGSETVLLVDDEEVVRRVAEGILKHHGYNILTAADGEEALEVYAANRDDVKLVLLDLTMPKLSGQDTLAALRVAYGNIPVVVCSGYLVDLEGFENETGHRPTAAIQKPYNVKDLARKVREIIDEATLADCL